MRESTTQLTQLTPLTPLSDASPALRRLSETMHAAGVVAGNGRPSLYDIYVRPAADGTVRLCVAHFGDVLLADETGFEEALAVEKRFLADHLPAPCE